MASEMVVSMVELVVVMDGKVGRKVDYRKEEC
jgi:hypothetical protein